jgi:hypothetical protein
LSKLADQELEFKMMLDEVNNRAPLSLLPKPKLPDMRGIIEQIGAKDREDGVHSMYTDQTHYDQLYAFLHMFSHANPIFIQDRSGSCLAHASHAVIEATAAIIRTVGYRLGWNQEAIIAAVYRISSFSTLSPEERSRILKETDDECGQVD